MSDENRANDTLSGVDETKITLDLIDGLLWFEGQPVACAWFVLCDRQATHLEDALALGQIPACDRCGERAKEGRADERNV